MSLNDEKKRDFSLLTFNILAPCYKRLSNEFDRESSYLSQWNNRHLAIIKLLQSLQIDIICLQEFWLDQRIFRDFYESHLSANYSSYYVQRTCDLDDGLAIFLRKKCPWKFIHQENLYLNDVGNRVGLLLHLEYENRPLFIINVHLTFPHNTFDRQLRVRQMNRFLQLIDEYRRSTDLLHQSCSMILCGDLNSPDEKDPVYHQLIQNYRSVYQFIHGREPKVTHLTHRNEQVCTDFIFYNSNDFVPINAELIPKGADQSQWNDSTHWTLSDHRAVFARFQYQFQ